MGWKGEELPLEPCGDFLNERCGPSQSKEGEGRQDPPRVTAKAISCRGPEGLNRPEKYVTGIVKAWRF